jgi:hypothetical protein
MPTVAHAQEMTRTKQITQDKPFHDASVCTGENIDGFAHAVFTEETTTSGTMTKFRTSNNENGKGTGASSGAQYQFQDFAQQQTITTARNFTDLRQETKHLIRTSRGLLPENLKDDEFLRQFIRMVVTNGEPNVTIDQTRIECH